MTFNYLHYIRISELRYQKAITIIIHALKYILNKVDRTGPRELETIRNYVIRKRAILIREQNEMRR